MSIYNLLKEVKLKNEDNGLCDFNGSLEEFLNIFDINNEDYLLFRTLYENDNSLRIITNLEIALSKDSISNMIIGYKDIFKVNKEALVIPYILYNKKEENEKALLLANEFAYAKGLYYISTEKDSFFEEYKNDIVTIDTNHINIIINLYSNLFTNKAGYLQREVDHKMYEDYDSILEHAIILADRLAFRAKADLRNIQDRDVKAKLINTVVVHWFLLKKYVYVQYMVDKKILKDVHNGNSRFQRNQAKHNADKIKFVSMSELWHTNYKY